MNQWDPVFLQPKTGMKPGWMGIESPAGGGAEGGTWLPCHLQRTWAWTGQLAMVLGK